MSTLNLTMMVQLSDAAVPLDELPQRTKTLTLAALQHIRRTVSVTAGTNITLDYGSVASPAFLFIENIGTAGTLIVYANNEEIARLAPRSAADTADGEFLMILHPRFTPYIDVDTGTGTLMYWVQDS